jgi:hypothetical protein
MLVTGLVRLFLIGLVASFLLSIWLSLVAVAVVVVAAHLEIVQVVQVVQVDF